MKALSDVAAEERQVHCKRSRSGRAEATRMVRYKRDKRMKCDGESCLKKIKRLKCFSKIKK